MPPPPPLSPKIPSKATAADTITISPPTASSSSLSTTTTTTMPKTLTSNTSNDTSNPPTSQAVRKIRITSSCNYTKPVIRLNYNKLHRKPPTSTTITASPAPPPALTAPFWSQAASSRVQLQAPPLVVRVPLPAPNQSAPDQSPTLASPNPAATAPKPIISPTTTALPSDTANKGSSDSAKNNSSSNISPLADSGSDLSEDGDGAATPDPDSDIHHRRRQRQHNHLTRSTSVPPPPPLPIQQQQPQTQELDIPFSSIIGDFGSIGEDEDPFKKMGLEPYSPIWLPSRAPSFEHLMRQRSYSPNPCHATTTTTTLTATNTNTDTTPPSQLTHGDDDDVVVLGRRDDQEILHESDLRNPLEEGANMTSKRDLKKAFSGSGKDRKEQAGESTHPYERFGKIKKRPSPLLPDHYDDLEDCGHDDDGDDDKSHQVDACGPIHPSLGCRAESPMAKRPRHEDLKHDKVPPPPPPPRPLPLPLSPHGNNNHGGSAEDVSGQGHPSSRTSPDNNNNGSINERQYFYQPPYDSLRLPPSLHHQPCHDQQDTFNNHNASYSYHRHPNYQPYQPRPWTSYRGINFHHPHGGFHNTRHGFQIGNGGDEGNWYHYNRPFFGRGRGRRRGRGGRGGGRGYGYTGFYGGHLPFHAHHDANGGMDQHRHQSPYQHRFENDDPFNVKDGDSDRNGGPKVDRPVEIAGGSLTGTGSGTASDPSNASPHPRPLPSPSLPPPAVSQGLTTHPHHHQHHYQTDLSPLSVASSRTTSITTQLVQDQKHHAHAPTHRQHHHHHSDDDNNINHKPATPPLLPLSSPTPSESIDSLLAQTATTTFASTTALPYSFPSSLHAPSPSLISPPPPPPPPPPPRVPRHHSSSSSSSSSPYTSHTSKSLSLSRSPSPASLASRAQARLSRCASSEISSLAQKLATEQTLRLQAQKQIRLLTHTLQDLEDRHQLVEQNYEVLLAKYRRKIE